MVGYYARFLKRDFEINVPLTKLLRKDQPYVWGDEQQEAFDALKKALTMRPDFSNPFTIQVDASGLSIGAVLTQVEEDGVHPIVFLSRMLTNAEKNYTVIELECLVVVSAIKTLRAYVDGSHFEVITDHSALRWLKSLKDPNGRLTRWALEMQQWNFDFLHCKSVLHPVPDALSRMYDEDEIVKVASFSEEVVKRNSWYVNMHCK